MEHADAIQKAVDDYLLMEAKARAFDLVHKAACDLGYTALVAELNRRVFRPAPPPPPCSIC